MNEHQKRMKALINLLRNTAEEEIDCDEFLTQAATFVERITEDPTCHADFAAVVQHLEVCPECWEEFDMLRALYRDAD